MPDFNKLEQEAEKAAGEHPEQVDSAINKAEQDVDQRVGQDHASQAEKAGSALEKDLGTQQGGQPPAQQ